MSDSVIPTQEEIAQLPRWAMVAFAARSARRAMIATRDYPWPEEHRRSIQWAVTIAEDFSSKGSIAEELTPKLIKKFNSDAYAASRAAGAARDFARKDAYAAPTNAARAAAYAARAAADALIPATTAPDLGVAADVVWSVQCAAVAPITAATIRADFDQLLRKAISEKWTNDTPVPPSVFDAAPPDEPSTPESYETSSADPSLELWIDPGHASQQTLQELLTALSELHIAAGGAGLEFKPDGEYLHIREHAHS